MSRILLDTNLLIYSIDKDSKYFEKANSFFSDPKHELFTTSKNLSEFLAVMTRLPKAPISLEDALMVIEDFKGSLTVLYPTEKSYSIFLNLLQKYRPAGLQIHDFEIISIGLANSINKVATFNKKDFEKVRELEIYSF
ncbi:MAG: type II toxin-antitoxin system VapC family toxin [Ignavibacteriaceae bacterium]